MVGVDGHGFNDNRINRLPPPALKQVGQSKDEADGLLLPLGDRAPERYINGAQERLRSDPAPPRKFSLAEQILTQLIRAGKIEAI